MRKDVCSACELALLCMSQDIFYGECIVCGDKGLYIGIRPRKISVHQDVGVTSFGYVAKLVKSVCPTNSPLFKPCPRMADEELLQSVVCESCRK